MVAWLAMTERPKIVVLDGHTLNPGDLSWNAVAQHGDLVTYGDTRTDQVVERSCGARILLTNKVRLGDAILRELSTLEFVSVLATGYDVVDVAYCRDHGVVVSNVPTYATESVAQHTFALLFAVTNRVAEHDRAVRDGEWARAGGFTFWNHPLTEVSGLTMGVVGLGRMGRRVAEIAQAFGMKVIAATRTPRAVDGVALTTIDEVFARADVVTLHCALNEQTRHLANARRLASMKSGAILVNTSRGALVDNDALADALDHGPLGAAALDVVDGEPIDAFHHLLAQPRNLIVTPHNAWTSASSRQRLMSVTAENVAAFLRGEPRNVVS